jgi:hypothetical protein
MQFQIFILNTFYFILNLKALSDFDLMQIMMQKIKRTESRCAIFEKEAKEKDKIIKILEDKVEFYKKMNVQNRAINANNASDEVVKDLEKKNLELQQQILDMEVSYAFNSILIRSKRFRSITFLKI